MAKAFATREEAVKWIESALVEKDGRLYISETVEVEKKLEKKTADHKASIGEKEALESRARKAENELKIATDRVSNLEGEVKDLREAGGGGEKMQSLIAEKNTLSSKVTEMTRSLELAKKQCEESEVVLSEMKKKTEMLERGEAERKIVDAVCEHGKKMGFPDEILANRAVVRRIFAGDLKIGEDGAIVDVDGTALEKYLEAQQKAMPSMLAPRSIGAGARPGIGTTLDPNAGSLGTRLGAARNLQEAVPEGKSNFKS